MKSSNFMKWATICLFIVTLMSCKKENDVQFAARSGNTLSAEDRDLIRQYENVGVYHNEGLEFIYAKIKTKIDEARVNNPSAQFIDVGVNGSELSNWSSEFVRGVYPTNFDFDYNPTFNRQIDNPELRNLSIVETSSRLGFNLSSELSEALNELEAILLDENLQLRSDSYEGLFERHLPNINLIEEKVAFISAVNVGKSSVQYWDENLGAWFMLDNQPAPQNLNGGIIAREDVKGAVGGAVTGAVGGAIAGAAAGGIGAIPGAAVGGLGGAVTGAVANSAAEAAAQIYDKYKKYLCFWC